MSDQTLHKKEIPVYIDPTAQIPSSVILAPFCVIQANVTLGENVRLGAGCVLEEGAVIGAGTQLGPYVTVAAGATVGEECEVGAHTSIGSQASIGASTKIGEHTTIYRHRNLGFGHREIIKDMIQAIREDRDPAVPGEEGRKALEIILAIYKCQETHEPVVFPLVE